MALERNSCNCERRKTAINVVCVGASIAGTNAYWFSRRIVVSVSAGHHLGNWLSGIMSTVLPSTPIRSDVLRKEVINSFFFSTIILTVLPRSRVLTREGSHTKLKYHIIFFKGRDMHLSGMQITIPY